MHRFPAYLLASAFALAAQPAASAAQPAPPAVPATNVTAPAAADRSATIVVRVTVPPVTTLYDTVAELSVSFTALMRENHLPGAFEPRSLCVHELDARRQPRGGPVRHQYEPGETNGTLLVHLAGESRAGTTRAFQVQFGSVPRVAALPPLITVIADESDAGEPAFKVITPNSSFYLQKKSHGVSTLMDRDQMNWIGYSSAKGSAGEFRGLPNIAPVEFHPGKPTGKKDLVLVSNGPLRAVFTGATLDDRWRTRWEVYPTFTRISLITPGDTPYWLLYEGTPAGKLQPDQQYVLLSDGAKPPLTERWERDLPAPEWAAFGDVRKQRVLFVAHPEDDALVEQYWPMEGNMTVFGFGRGVAEVNGRKRSAPLLTAAKNSMLFGLIDTDDAGEIARRVNAALTTVRLEPMVP
jgi:hypothetical protein